MKALSLGRCAIYELIRSGRLHSLKEGGARLIPVDALTEYKSLLLKEAQVSR